MSDERAQRAPGAAAVRRRPVPVRVLVALVWVNAAVAVLVAAASAAALLEAFEPDRATSAERAVAVGGIAGSLVAFVALVALAVALRRGWNGARILLSAVLAFRVADAVHAAATDGAGEELVSAAVALATLGLAWTPASTAWFQGERERELARALGVETGPRAWLRRGLEFGVQAIVVWTTIGLAPGVSADSWTAALAAAIAIAVATSLLQPLWLRVASRFGWAGAAVVAFGANAVTVGLALWLAPGVSVSGPGWALVASWIFSILMTAVSWLFSASSHDYLLVHATRASLRGDRPERDDVPGVLFVQLDGVSAPLLEQELRAGNLPTISRWVRSGSHTWTEWTARVPSTTPVSQAGILHGTNHDIPAFRWWDRDLGRLLVANRPADASLIEERLSDGRGLLADRGVSISNLFSGDAERSYLTMSGLREGDRHLGPSRSYAAFFTHPAGLARALVRTLGEMVKEVWQARRQEWRDVQPRVPRHGSYVALRGVTNVLLRDLNVALVIEAMMDGARSIYVDFVDYDEIAHHAGVTRPESLASLYGLDAVLATFERFAAMGVAPRDYRIVLVSDHGQSQGATFAQRYGESLEDLVRRCTGGRAVGAEHDEESGGPARLLVRQLAEQDSVTGRVARRALGRRDARAGDDASSPPTGDGPALAVIGSGNLGGVWFTDSPERLTLAELEAAHPGLIETLATHPGIGFVVVRAGSGPVAIGPRGLHRLATGEVEGEDPLAPFGAAAREDFLRAAQFPHAPDLYLNSLHETALDEVAAFEELVGCHGGLGGWQTRPLLVFPAEWELEPSLLSADGRLHGATAVHRQLVRWLEALGQRESLRESAPEGAGSGIPADSP